MRHFAVKFLIAVSIWLFSFNNHVRASHVRAADIKVERTCGTLTFRITVTAYLNSASSTPFGRSSSLYFGDGTFADIPIIIATLRPDLGQNISVASFTTTHTYSANGTYNITYIEEHRNAGILNVENSKDMAYVSFVKINTSSSFGCNHYPVLSVAPLDRGCKGVAFFHNSGAYDVDGDSLSYELAIPAVSQTALATYTAPNNSTFYSNYNTANEAGNGQPAFFIDPLTGLVTWDAPGLIGEYNIAFRVLEWRKLADGTYVQISATTRDMQIVIEDCNNTRPDLIIPNDTCVVAGTEVNAVIKGIDKENNTVKIEVFSELQTLPNPPIYSPAYTDFLPSLPPASLAFQWKTECNNVRQQPFQVVFKITDNPPKGPKLVTYKTWRITIIAPAPVWKSVLLDVVKLNGLLSFEKYTCSNVKAFQVWRKVGSYPHTPGYCEIGIPAHSGYQLIDVIPGDKTYYIDTNFGNGLSPGANYCYRIVALVADTKSYVSEEMCIGPVRADAPVITHVSVEKTSANDGKIRVSWRSPFDIDKIQFPEPYEYEVYRADGFIGDTSIVRAGYVKDTTFLDASLNTHEKVFNYRVVVYSKPATSESFIPVDTSAIASSVRLSVAYSPGGMTLHWRDSVPWSNVIATRPYHLIYRGEGQDVDENQLKLIDSVDVTLNGFEYTDPTPTRNICVYKVLTQGTYGNQLIPIQENLSQMLPVNPVNDLEPCAPAVTIDKVDCAHDDHNDTCSQNPLSNTINWEGPDEANPECRLDIVAYNIYVSTEPKGEFILLTTVTSTEFTETDLLSSAKCYKVSAVDTRGHESELSEMACNDNCPYFELPNVFTPNGDGCNEIFTARSDGTNVAGSGSPCTSTGNNKCIRFVRSVDIKIVNRWGKEVFHNNGSIYVDWDGRDKDGTECNTGVYYYSADVVFDVLDPEKRNQTFKGWIHLLK